MPLVAPKWSHNARLQRASNNSPSMHPNESDHTAVSLLQEVLISQGFAIPSGPTGNYLGETQAAVRAVETRFHLVRDTGIAGHEVLTALDTLLRGQTPTPPAVAQHGRALALTDVPLALKKVNASIDAIAAFESTFVRRALAQPGDNPPDFNQVTVDALQTHFRLALPDITAPPARGVDLSDTQFIRTNFTKIREYLNHADAHFRDDMLNPDTMAETNGGGGPTFFGTAYRNTDIPGGAKLIGPNSRAAVVIHEPVHAIDSQSVAAVDINESSPGYATQPADNSLHNPCSYAAFAAHIFNKADPNPRFGRGSGQAL